MVSATNNLVYFKTEQDVWSPAKLIEQNAKTALVDDDGKQVKVDLSEYRGNALPQQNVDDQGRLVEIEDMANLSYLHEVSLPEPCHHCEANICFMSRRRSSTT
jgi:myosin heavy subunit